MIRKRLYLLLALVLISSIIVFLWVRSDSINEISADPNKLDQLLPAPNWKISDWPGWRGASRSGHVTGSPPTDWSREKNIAWKVSTPGKGWASPIICNELVLILTSDVTDQTVSLLAYSLQTGELRWNTRLAQGQLPKIHSKNSHASSTPICDGQSIYALHVMNDQLFATAVSLEGKILWRKVVGPYLTEHGYGSAPLIYEGLLIVPCESSMSHLRRLKPISFLAALDRSTGETIWRKFRPLNHSYGTPILADHEGSTQLIHPGNANVSGYDPRTGELLWFVNWNCLRAANSPVQAGNKIIACTNATERLCLGIPLEGVGEKSEKISWKNTRATGDVPSPIVVGEHVYIAEDNGILHCVQHANGEVLWKGRLGSGENVTASPIYANGLLYFFTESGKCFVIKPGKSFEMVGRNDLGEMLLASPAVSGGSLIIRTAECLWCVRK